MFLQKCNRHSTFKWEREQEKEDKMMSMRCTNEKRRKLQKNNWDKTVNFEIKFNTQQRLQSIVDLPSFSFQCFLFFLKEFFYSLFCHPLSYTTNNKTTSNNNINWNNRELFFYKKIRAADIWRNILQKYIRDAIIVSFFIIMYFMMKTSFSLRYLVFSSLLRENRNWFSFPFLDIPPFSLCLCFTHNNIWEEEANT